MKAIEMHLAEHAPNSLVAAGDTTDIPDMTGWPALLVLAVVLVVVGARNPYRRMRRDIERPGRRPPAQHT